MNFIILGIGVYLIIFSFLNRTKNVISGMLYKVIPFFSGAFLVVYFLMISNIIKINI
jgi:hypothetical protein